jgi:putative transposase
MSPWWDERMDTIMKRHRHTPEQAVRKIREGERLLNEQELAEVLRHLEVTESTFNRWRAQYGGMKADEAKRLKTLAVENQRLKKLVAEQALDIDMLKELSKGRMKVNATRSSGPSWPANSSSSKGLAGTYFARRTQIATSQKSRCTSRPIQRPASALSPFTLSVVTVGAVVGR